ncbi:MAG: ATP-binding protein [Candidatus Sericytochromatia bacterium]|nr:ATP-binding protein [Candidatus Tanganyikabacteria bacterium]
MCKSGIVDPVAPVYVERAADSLIRELLGELPALLLVGPRATGKTTTAARHARTIVRLDRQAEAEAFRADPDAALRGLGEPVLLDEWQSVPGVLGAVKRAVDVDSRPGRYLLTGSVRADLDAATWPGTGRLVRVPIYGMTVAELHGRSTTPLFDRLARSEEPGVAPDTPDLRGYLELALKGGFPEAALALTDRTRSRWLESYVDQLLTRDAATIEGARDPARLRRYFEAYALNSAGVVEDATLIDASGLNRKTANAYERLLENLLVVERIPPWTSSRLQRLVRSSKRFLIDPALLAGILRVDVAGVLRDGNLLGRTLETFVAAQLRATAAVAESRPRLFHLRQAQGRHEIDLVAEQAEGIFGIEVKATAAPNADAAKHLCWLRDRIGPRFVKGIVLHTGPRVYQLADRIFAVPISTLWA